jgi:hypothetical protein
MLVNPRPILEEQSSIIITSIDEGGVQPSLETLAKWYVLGGEVTKVSKHLARRNLQ